MIRSIILGLFVWLLTPAGIWAAFAFQVDSATPPVFSASDQEIIVQLSVTDLPSASYFRVAFQKESGGSYFGQMQDNSGNWVDIQSLSADCRNYFLVSDTQATFLTLHLRIGNSDAESGSYLIKGHRFTSTSCSATVSQNSISINYTLPTLPPTPVSTSTPKPTSTPTPAPKPSSTPKPTLTPQPTPAPSTAPSLSRGEVKSASTSAPPVSPAPQPAPPPSFPSRHLLPGAIIALGVICLGFFLIRV